MCNPVRLSSISSPRESVEDGDLEAVDIGVGLGWVFPGMAVSLERTWIVLGAE